MPLDIWSKFNTSMSTALVTLNPILLHIVLLQFKYNTLCLINHCRKDIPATEK